MNLHGIFVWLSLGAPLLGSVETIKATLSGATFGLPVSEVSYYFHNPKCNIFMMQIILVLLPVNFAYL